MGERTLIVPNLVIGELLTNSLKIESNDSPTNKTRKHLYESRKETNVHTEDVRNKFHRAFTRSDTDFLTAAIKRRTCRKYATLWRTKGAACESIKRKNLYMKQCRRLNIIPSRRHTAQIGGSYVSVRNCNLRWREVKAICRSLTGDSAIKTLDLSGNKLSTRECGYLKKLLAVTQNLSTLALEDCQLSSDTLIDLSHCIGSGSIKHLSIRGNNISDRDYGAVTRIIQTCSSLQHLNVSHNNFEGDRHVAKVLGENSSIEELDFSWNHIRRRGSIAFAMCLQENSCLTDVNFSWNGFAYEGCAALSDALKTNITLTKLDISCNRIHPPAMLELTKGLCNNKTLQILDLSQNPITPVFTSVLVDAIKRSPEMALNTLLMENIIVDKAFVKIVSEIQLTRKFDVTYELALPVTGMTTEKMRREVEPPTMFNTDPLRLLYMLKEKNRARDFFRRINKDDDESLSADELRLLFREAGVPVSSLVIEKIIDFMDTDNDGKIDLREFLEGDRRIRKMSRATAKSSQQGLFDDEYTKYSRSYRKGHIDPMTYRLNVNELQNPLTLIESEEPLPGISTPRRLSMF